MGRPPPPQSSCALQGGDLTHCPESGAAAPSSESSCALQEGGPHLLSQEPDPTGLGDNSEARPPTSPSGSLCSHRMAACPHFLRAS